jgi:hydroxymethylpyrimidine pyrophosphatase-like HAD family hydrolase
MGNGNEKLKIVADFVTKKSSEDGIEFAKSMG